MANVEAVSLSGINGLTGLDDWELVKFTEGLILKGKTQEQVHEAVQQLVDARNKRLDIDSDEGIAARIEQFERFGMFHLADRLRKLQQQG